jgi:putative peptidoglycan lipid II flippase
LTLGSRVLGLVRDVLLARLVEGAARDAFLVAWLIPNLFRRLFGEGALSAAFIPSYAALVERGDEEGQRRLASSTLGLLCWVMAAVVVIVIGVTLLPFDWGTLFPGDEPEKIELIRQLVRVMAPYAFLVCVVAFLAGIHQVRRSFALPAAMPILLNLVWIAVLAILGAAAGGGALGAGAARWMALGIVAAGVLQLVVTWLPVRRAVPAPALFPARGDAELATVMRRFVPMTLGLGIYQLNLVMDRFIAESFIAGDGAVTALYLGDRLMQLPQALVGIAVATAAFPEFSRLAGAGEREGLAASVTEALRLCLALAIPAAVGLALVAGPTVELFFRGAAFDESMVTRTAWVVAIVAVAVVASSVLHVLVRAHYALGETAAPVRIGMVAVAVNLVLNLSLVWSLEERGLAIATVVSSAVNALLLVRTLRRLLPELELRPVVWLGLRALAASALMAAAVAACLVWALPPGEGVFIRVARVIVPVLVGGGVVLVVAKPLGVIELGAWVARRARTRRHGGKDTDTRNGAEPTS